MKKKDLLGAILFCFMIATQSALFAEDVKIETIQKDPVSYENEAVQVKGLVKQYIEDNKVSTNMYILVGDEGGFMRVLTSTEGMPETYKKYKVRGILIRDADNGSYFISEQSRDLAESAPVVQEASMPTEPVPNAIQTTDAFPMNMILIIGLVLLIMIIGYFLFSNRRRMAMESVVAPVADEKPGYSRIPDPETETQDFSTIHLATGHSKTMVFIPGKFRIISGEDAGKSFQVTAFPSSRGNVVTIGRETISGDRQYAHIQLKEKTVSRKQAEIVQKDGQLFVRNLSTTNFTQVDGVQLKPGEETEIKHNSTIRTGEVEFQYLVN